MSDAHHFRSPETWAAVREAYLADIPAADLCERYDIPMSTFRARAKAEGWRRADQPEAEPLDDLYPAPDADAPLRTSAQLADAAWLGADRAMARGRAGDAERWMRLHRQLRALAADEAREAKRATDEDARRTHETLDAIRQVAVAGARDAQTLTRALDAGVPLDDLDHLDSVSESRAPASRLRRVMLEAALKKALRQGDHAAAHRIRAKLGASDPQPPPSTVILGPRSGPEDPATPPSPPS